jgi:hypothetical protein
MGNRFSHDATVASATKRLAAMKKYVTDRKVTIPLAGKFAQARAGGGHLPGGRRYAGGRGGEESGGVTYSRSGEHDPRCAGSPLQ